jgi:hypothetical protein
MVGVGGANPRRIVVVVVVVVVEEEEGGILEGEGLLLVVVVVQGNDHHLMRGYSPFGIVKVVPRIIIRLWDQLFMWMGVEMRVNSVSVRRRITNLWGRV